MTRARSHFALILIPLLTACATKASPAPSSAISKPGDDIPPAISPAAGVIATVAVPGGGAPVETPALAAGDLYLLRASGAIDAGGTKVDAEYDSDGRDVAGAVDVGVDVGRLQIHAATGRKPTPDGPGRMKWFGPPRADHTYVMIVGGAGAPLKLKFVGKTGATSSAGAITVALFRLSPPPPAIGPPLEIASVPLLNVTRSTQLSTAPGAVYLLQASGAGKVGGGGLGLGDAEYMDWAADGAGANEGEASADFGLGVDESRDAVKDVGHGARYEPRARWWGRFRTDHVYYMLFSGTGRPIALNYHDSGYGDNSKTDALTFKIFAVP
jgi:hypothetical protein